MLWVMQRKQKVLTLLCCFLTLTTVVLKYSYHESSSMYYLNILHGWSDSTLPNKPCACEHCVSEAHTSPWFDERFNHSIRPLMSENTVLSEDTYIWWQVLMNRAVTAGYEKDVGSKTTHHFMYPESAKHLQPNTSLVLIPFKTLDLQWLVSALTTGNITQ
ncbi:UNVERIFIED_CONTAM: hypothetical protein FKN15_021360 [Acipenser sinensis]